MTAIVNWLLLVAAETEAVPNKASNAIALLTPRKDAFCILRIEDGSTELRNEGLASTKSDVSASHVVNLGHRNRFAFFSFLGCHVKGPALPRRTITAASLPRFRSSRR